MVAIETKYAGPTETQPARIIVRAGDIRRIYSKERLENADDRTEDIYRKAAEAFRDEMGWPGRLVGGGTRTGYVFVIDDGGEQ